jgi:nucleoside-diphosphate-sugar epimerase
MEDDFRAARIPPTIRGTRAAVHVAASESGPILLTGATGYVGGRLLPRLVREGLAVRCLTRRPELLAKLAPRDVEIAAGDLLELGSLTVAMAGVHIAY